MRNTTSAQGFAVVAIAMLCLGADVRGAPAQTTERPSTPRWDVALSANYEFDSNPLRNSQQTSDAHLRVAPAVSLLVPTSARGSLWARSSFRGDRYGATTALNGRTWNASVGLTRRAGRASSVWLGYSWMHSAQPDLLQRFPSGLSAYVQQGATAGVARTMRRTDMLRVEGAVSRRDYRTPSPGRNTATAGQRDPIISLDTSWTHALRSARVRLGGQVVWHSSNNPRYRFTMPTVSLSYLRRVGASGELLVAASRGWLRYSDRLVRGTGGLPRQDAITEVGVGFESHRQAVIVPFVRFAQQWDSSTDPFRTFTDRRVAVGFRVHAQGGGRRRTVSSTAPSERQP